MTIGLNGTSCVKISLVLLNSRERKKEKLLTVMGNIMKVERSYPGGAQKQKFVRAAASARRAPVSFTELQL